MLKIDRTALNTLDIGCGDRMRTIDGFNAYGVDINVIGDNIVNIDVFTEDLPFDDEMFNRVYAYDFLEHIPTVIYLNNKIFHPRIHFFNEVFRVMKRGAVFESFTPFVNSENFRTDWCQDPTHCMPFCINSFNYFMNLGGEWERLQGLYGITAKFELIKMEPRVSHLYVELLKA